MKKQEIPRQKEFIFQRGGKREGAGRPKKKKTKMCPQVHLKREAVGKYPVHITLRLVDGLPSLRSKKMYRLFKMALLKGQCFGLNICHFSLLKNHFHLICEADDESGISKGMQSIAISLAKKINFECRRKGKVFFDRYHIHILKTLREVRTTLRYVLLNAAKHLKRAPYVDPYSSGCVFLDWKKLIGKKLRCCYSSEIAVIVSRPQYFGLKVGWKVSC